ncbi:tetratricopeptide repeat protein [Pseudoalteromonas denitrificans]|uniref:histidine kinase n=1 Tax=Pseudoalteromonas denitrificans DSM 6059 TaxID=1123010 RepID=A0A1I1PFS1_9GAMM|nr:tetratricopeptide repeat protein [Pseudoalteromonas denitrificans]SFD04910.1 Signal transduction histidine kinase [Pseudoalteromonas denitrificans DSM 6059]
MHIFLLLFVFFSSFSLAKTSLSEHVEHAFNQENNDERVRLLNSLSIEVNQQQNTKLKMRYFRLLARSLKNISEYEKAHESIDLAISFAKTHTSNLEYGKLIHTKGVIYNKQQKYQQGIKLLSEAVVIYKQYNLLLLEVNAMRKIATAHEKMSDYQNALRLLTPYLSRLGEINDQKEVSYLYSSIARIHGSLQLYPEALELELKALNILKKSGEPDINLTESFYAIGEIYRALEEFNSAKIYFSKALSLDLASGNKNDLGHSQVKMAQVVLGLNQTEDSLEYAQHAFETFKNDKSVRNQAWAQSNIGLAYFKLNQLEKAENNLYQAYLVIKQEPNDNYLLSGILHELADVKYQLEQYGEAHDLARKSLAIAIEKSYIKYKVNALEILVKIEIQIQNFEAASQFQSQLLSATKHFNHKVYNNRLSVVMNSLDIVNKDLEIKALELEKSNKQTQLDQEKAHNKITLLIFVIVFILLIGFILKLWNKRRLIKLEKQLLSESIERKNALFSDISHDLRTPLSVLKLQLESLEFDLVNDRNAEFKSMHQKIHDINQLISDIYELSRLESGTLKIQKEVFECKACLNNFSNEFKALARNFNYTQEITLKDDVKLYACRKKIQQVLVNLASNSIKYTDVPGRIHFSCKQTRNKLILSVSDSSPGVNKKAHNQIFERLYREEKSRNRDLGGSGLGLAICKSIIELHQGSIMAKDSKLGGVKIIVTLPLIENEAHNLNV